MEAKKHAPAHTKKGERKRKQANQRKKQKRTSDSHIAKPPLPLPHETEPEMMLAHRRRPYTGEQSRSRIHGSGKHRTGCA